MKLKWRNTLLLLPFIGIHVTSAQSTFNDIQYLDINKFNVANLLHGDMFYDPVKEYASCEFPKGSGKHASSTSSLWSVAHDYLGNNYASAQIYRALGNDYWPGPLDALGACSYATSEKWARIWKVSQSDIIAFKALPTKTFSTIPKDILEWPGKGSIYAKGRGGVSLSVTEAMAPFKDVDADGVYDPFKGDYPEIKGDQMLWWIFNDNGATRTASGGSTPFKIEYRATAYGYSRGGAVDNIVFYEFDMRNKSTVRYLDFRFGLMNEADLGAWFDDYIAFDSVHRMGITYNGNLPDGVNGANSYGMHPPLVGLSFIKMPGDVYPGGMLPAGTFNTFENAPGALRVPKTTIEYMNYMYGKDADGTPLTGGNYLYPITKGTGQFLCETKAPLKDRRFLTTTGNYNFQPGTQTIVAMALMATDTVGYACGTLANFNPLTDLADTAWKLFYNPMPALSVKDVEVLSKSLRLYPNPAVNDLIIDSYTGMLLKKEMLKVYDIAGREVNMPLVQSNKQIKIDVTTLAPGIYTLMYNDDGMMATQRFIKK